MRNVFLKRSLENFENNVDKDKFKSFRSNFFSFFFSFTSFYIENCENLIFYL